MCYKLPDISAYECRLKALEANALAVNAFKREQEAVDLCSQLLYKLVFSLDNVLSSSCDSEFFRENMIFAVSQFAWGEACVTINGTVLKDPIDFVVYWTLLSKEVEYRHRSINNIILTSYSETCGKRSLSFHCWGGDFLIRKGLPCNSTWLTYDRLNISFVEVCDGVFKATIVEKQDEVQSQLCKGQVLSPPDSEIASYQATGPEC